MKFKNGDYIRGPSIGSIYRVIDDDFNDWRMDKGESILLFGYHLGDEVCGSKERLQERGFVKISNEEIMLMKLAGKI